jgi:hypothetical protein
MEDANASGSFADALLAAGALRHKRAEDDLILHLELRPSEIPLPTHAMCVRIVIIEAAKPCILAENGGKDEPFRPSRRNCLVTGVMVAQIACAILELLQKDGVELSLQEILAAAAIDLFSGYTPDEQVEMLCCFIQLHQYVNEKCEADSDLRSMMNDIARMSRILAVYPDTPVVIFEAFQVFLDRALPPTPTPPASS